MSPARAARRVMPLAELSRLAAEWRAGGERVVLANGVFDLLHVGHVRYLRGARALGDRLVVAVNGDRSAASLKGAGRPVMGAGDRALLVAALRGVDAVVVFEEPTVEGLLDELRPTVHAKGTDYTRESVPERGTAAAAGIETAIAGDPKAHASRELVSRVRERYGRRA
jgi:rfaE bifunctional protein nucleotidyltransferase chain/domain